MNPEIGNLYKQYFELYNQIDFDVRDEDYKVLDYHI